MRCLCCGKELNNTHKQWHEKCIRRFFGTDCIPQISIDKENLMEIAVRGAVNRITVPGVQKKISLSVEEEKGCEPRLTVVNYPAGYILKPQADNFKCLPELEHMVMLMAEETGIKTAEHALIRASGEYAYITKRMDRRKDRMLAMEDFCQIAGRLTQDKYKGSYEVCGKIVKEYSSRPMLDLSELFLRLVFCFATGNSDMHLKNFSLIETEPASREYVLSAAYDLLPVNVVMLEDKEEMALTLRGEKSKLKRADFEVAAENMGLAGKVSSAMIERVVSMEAIYCEIVSYCDIPPEMKEAMNELIRNRIGRLRG